MDPTRNRSYAEPATHTFTSEVLAHRPDTGEPDVEDVRITLTQADGMPMSWREWENNIEFLLHEHGIPEIAPDAEPSQEVQSELTVVESPGQPGQEPKEYTVITRSTLRFFEAGPGATAQGTMQVRWSPGEPAPWRPVATCRVRLEMRDSPANRDAARALGGPEPQRPGGTPDTKALRGPYRSDT